MKKEKDIYCSWVTFIIVNITMQTNLGDDLLQMLIVIDTVTIVRDNDLHNI